MDRVEATADLPDGWEGVANYDRYYAFSGSADGRHVTAAFVFSKKPGRQWVDRADLPDGTDQGCLVIIVEYDVKADKVLSAVCNGAA